VTHPAQDLISNGRLPRFVSEYPAQPATAFWRAIELDTLIRHGLPIGKGLDLGCGDGILTNILLSEVGHRDLVGIDPDPQEIEAASQFSFYTKLHCAPAQAVPEPSGSFDFVLSNSVLEHISDVEPVIAEVSRLLRTGGEFVFTVPGPAFHRSLRGSVIPGVPRAKYLARLDRRLLHYHYLAPAQWRELCLRHGLSISSIVGYVTPIQTRRWESLSRLTGGIAYAILGGSKKPIEIQRVVGARAIQNRYSLPHIVSRSVARLISVGLAPKERCATEVDVAHSGGLLIHGYRA
jgi:SAM-dependent methyltransferase